MSNGLLVLWWSVYLLACLKVIPGQDIDLSGSGNFSILEKEYTFTCTVGVSVPTVRFQRGSKSVCNINSETCSANQSPGYSCRCLINSNILTLTILSVGLRDEDNWTCQEFGGTHVSNIIELPVYYSPIISSSMELQNINGGGYFDAILRCDVNSKPASIIEWSNDTTVILNGSSTYTVNDVPCDSQQNYTCTANNGIGSPATEEFSVYMECNDTSTTPTITSTVMFTSAEYDSTVESFTTTTTSTTTETSTDSTSSSLPSLTIDTTRSSPSSSPPLSTSDPSPTTSIQTIFNSTKSLTTSESSHTSETHVSPGNGTDKSLGMRIGIPIAALTLIIVIVIVVIFYKKCRTNADQNAGSDQEVPSPLDELAMRPNEPEQWYDRVYTPTEQRRDLSSPEINTQPSTYNRSNSTNSTDANSIHVDLDCKTTNPPQPDLSTIPKIGYTDEYSKTDKTLQGDHHYSALNDSASITERSESQETGLEYEEIDSLIEKRLEDVNANTEDTRSPYNTAGEDPKPYSSVTQIENEMK